MFSSSGVSLPLRWRWRWCPAVRPGLVAVSASLISTAPRRQTQQEEEGQGRPLRAAEPLIAVRRGSGDMRWEARAGPGCQRGSQRGRAGLDVDGRVGLDGQPAEPHWHRTDRRCVRARRARRTARGQLRATCRGRHRTREPGGLSSGSHVFSTRHLFGKGFPVFLPGPHRIIAAAAGDGGAVSFTIGRIFILFLYYISIFWLWHGFHFVF